MLHIAYDDKLLGWQLGKGHPTNPIRAKHATELLWNRMPGLVHVDPITRKVSRDELALLHDREYVHRTMNGDNAEWSGTRQDLAKVARHMFAGTQQLVDGILDGEVRYGFSPQGAKHHAMANRGSGFCVYADFAHAATILARAGHRVLVLDTDAHHGDGTEALTRDNPDVMTVSVHDRAIFPGTGHWSDVEDGVINYPLRPGSGDSALVAAVAHALDAHAESFDPTVLLWAIGGDGYVDDPLSTLRYTYAGYSAVSAVVGAFAGVRDMPILFGGAGGYLPHTHTPRVWATVAAETYAMTEKVALDAVDAVDPVHVA